MKWKILCPAMVHHGTQALTMHNNTSVHLADKALGSLLSKGSTAFLKFQAVKQFF